ncbi:hypothetical protein EXIGLDRAFT_62571 [Exidia glandulosa HHB12029]|uniref:Uncharacterized protein n=1 Tax=Exidia glandulosa HHB12029 TaxID=1314781 RepID=A0A165NZV1_EXIGL|nr:hypothetical protein EXIGLDRAFT_62571 [Exidia glandulosa HHB12029]
MHDVERRAVCAAAICKTAQPSVATVAASATQTSRRLFTLTVRHASFKTNHITQIYSSPSLRFSTSMSSSSRSSGRSSISVPSPSFSSYSSSSGSSSPAPLSSAAGSGCVVAECSSVADGAAVVGAAASVAAAGSPRCLVTRKSQG